MVSMKIIKATNEAFQKAGQTENLVGLFAGGTSGIGESIMKTFARYTKSPKIYFVGRSEPDAERIISEVKGINTNSTISFIKADLTSIKNVDKVCEEFKSNESHLSVLCMSQGYLTFASRIENAEGLDKKMTINYYGRLRLILNLLPHLEASAREVPHFRPQILSILGAGIENPEIFRTVMKKNDLDLKDPQNFSVLNASAMVMTLTSLAMEELSLRHPNMDWMHVWPGFVFTKIMRDLPAWVRGLYWAFRPILWFATERVEDVGEGCIYLMTRGQDNVQENVDATNKSKIAGNLFLGDWSGSDKKDWRKFVKKEGWEEERTQFREEAWRASNVIFKKVDDKLREEL